jgi:hypothetical protein
VRLQEEKAQEEVFKDKFSSLAEELDFKTKKLDNINQKF